MQAKCLHRSWIVLALVVGLFLSACAANPPTTNPNAVAPTSSNATTTAQSASGTAPAPSTNNLGGKIIVTYMASGTYDEAAKTLASTFKQQHSVDVQVAAFPWAALRQNNTNDLISNGGQFDVMSGSYYLADVYSYFEPLTSMIERDNYGQGMIDGLMQPGRSEWVDGKQIGVPYGVDAYGMLYRADIFQELGIDPASMKTWDDFLKVVQTLAASEKLKSEGVAPFVHEFGTTGDLPAIFFGAYGGSFVTADGKYQLETEKAVNAIMTLKSLVPYAPSNALSLTTDDANSVFLDGKAAILLGWPSFVRTSANDATKSKVVGKWATAPFPLNQNGFTWLSLWQLFMPKTSQNKEAAWQWIKDYTSEANAKVFFETYGIGSVYSATYKDPELLTKNGNDFPGTLANLSNAKNPPLSGEAQDFMANTIGEVLQGTTSPADAVKAINDKWSTLPVPPALLQAAQASGLQAK